MIGEIIPESCIHLCEEPPKEGHVLKAFAASQQRRTTLIFLAVFCLAAIGALVIGLDGNTPANVLALVASVALVLVFVHPWRRVREFKYLFYASGLGFAVFVILHNLFDAPLQAIFQVLSVVAFLAAIFVCPPALIIGLGGVLIVVFRGREGGQSEPAASKSA